MTTKAIEAGARAIYEQLPGHGDINEQMSNECTSAMWLAMSKACIEAAIASGELVPASAGQPSGKPASKIIAGLEEALAVSKGEQPAARIYVQGHAYVPASAVAAERERCAQAAEGPLYLDKYRGEPGHNWWHEKESGDYNRYGNGRHDAAAAIRALEPASGEYVLGWRTMDSAPKDMTEIIVLCGRKDVRLGWYFAPSSTTFGWRDQHNAPIKPTHWMPMPPRLTAATSNGSGK